jgi:D-inositol-3-phosphate glycosyltransferase
MVRRLAIHHPNGRLGLGQNVFGKDVANLALFRALALHGGYESLAVLTNVLQDQADIVRDLLGGQASATRIETATILHQPAAAAAGALLRGQPELESLAWLRRSRVGDRAYSLLGLVHTIAPPIMRDIIARTALAPTQPWDAVICTSPSVQAAIRTMFDEWLDHLGARFGASARPMPHLPLIPLGVDLPALQAQADRPDARAAMRAALGLAEDDILVIWVGRLSFFEKAFPQPMFRAVEQAAKAHPGKRIHFAMGGWFPDPKTQRPFYEAAAQTYCPSVPVHFVDGNDTEALGQLWAGADVFLSLVDNVQETFGITPLEAMASGLPVVVSDWDGYRYTVRDGIEGFLSPTLGGPPGPFGQRMIDRHVLGMDSYQTYVGVTAQHTAVHVGRCAQALSDLIASPDLRARMGAAGRERVRTAFDWPVVVGQFNELLDELAQIRATSEGYPAGPVRDPIRGDPFEAFAGFASEGLGPQTRLSLAPGAGPADLERSSALVLDNFAASWRTTPAEAARLMALIGEGRVPTVAAALEHFPPARHPYIELTIAWMAKMGIVDWL